MGDLLLAICIQKASSEPILLVAGDLKSPPCTKDPAGASLPHIQPHVAAGAAGWLWPRWPRDLVKASGLITAEESSRCFSEHS